MRQGFQPLADWRGWTRGMVDSKLKLTPLALPCPDITVSRLLTQGNFNDKFSPLTGFRNAPQLAAVFLHDRVRY
jgi:hypothetical protein